jgi:ring-1,2-phenylacetyl-CoA epoxidase subunit PaaC
MGIDPSGLASDWLHNVSAVLSQATLQQPAQGGYLTKGKDGQHSEHLSYLLAEMQSLARAHPQGVW